MHKISDEFEFGQIGPLTMELVALERLKHFHRVIMGKWCLHASSFIFNRIIKVAGNQDRHKSSAWGENLIILVIYFTYPVNPFIARSGVSQLREFP